jgi:hypothetical protein
MTGNSFWAWTVLKDQPFFPTSLGGTGAFALMLVDFPYKKHCDQLGSVQLILMSYHTGALLVHIFDTRKNDFLEMLLHHSVTMFLYGFSYMFNIWEPAVVIAYLHDVSDIPVCLTRLFVETDYKKLTVIWFLTNAACWFYVRLLVFPQLVYTIWVTPVDLGHWCVLPIYVFMLSCLVVLHAYWFYMFVYIFYIQVFKKGYSKMSTENFQGK